MAVYTLEIDRLIMCDNKPAFKLAKREGFSETEFEEIAHRIVRLLNADEANPAPVLDPTGVCALVIDDAPAICAKCGASEGNGECQDNCV